MNTFFKSYESYEDDLNLEADIFISKIDFKNIQLVPLSDLKPIIQQHDEMFLTRFKDGINKPLIVNKFTHYIQDGNHRYFGALKYNIERVPVIFIDDLPMHLRKRILTKLRLKNY